MNHDEKPQQRWEIMKEEFDGDPSGTDSKSNAGGEPEDKRHELDADLVLLENDRMSDVPGSQHHDNLDDCYDVHLQTPESVGKKIKSSNALQKKSEGCTVKENKMKRNLNSEEMVTFRDLKAFADSLMCELTVARENMFAHMREEMRKLVASRSDLNPNKKKVRVSQMNNVHPQNGTEAGLKHSGEPMEGSVKTNIESTVNESSQAVAEAVKHDHFPDLTTINEPHKGDNRSRLSTTPPMFFANTSDGVPSSSDPLNNHILTGLLMNNSSLHTEVGKFINAENFLHQYAEFQPEQQFGSFSRISHKTSRLLGQNSFQTVGMSVGFPIPLHQQLANGSNVQSLICSNNSFLHKSEVALGINGGTPALSESIYASSISNEIHKTYEELVSVKPQDLRDNQFFLSSLRDRHEAGV